MKKILFSFILPLGLGAHAQQYWQQEVNYDIEVNLNDSENSLEGFVQMEYTNHSPDTLYFIWLHLWPNAYKNDRTAFSDQLLENNRTDFYFSDKDQRGYINRLDFRVNGIIAATEDHPEFIDIIKLILPQPLAPGTSIKISTPFFEKLPFNFSRGGHVGQSYQITQWYPKPAVYDSKGWHPMPYLDQGEFYGELGSYKVRISVPKNYVVAATGELQNEEEKKWMLFRKPDVAIDIDPGLHKKNNHQKHYPLNHDQSETSPIPADTTNRIKTLEYKQDKIHDFAWFASQKFVVDHDTIQLASGRVIEAYSFYEPEEKMIWSKSILFIKDAIRFHSSFIGEYPFNTISIVEAKMGSPGGMEYPTIACISPLKKEKELDLTINHEIGHNWFYAAIGSNERRYPWMDEGINTYYDHRYEKWKYQTQSGEQQSQKKKTGFFEKKMPQNINEFLINVLTKEKLDQPISTSSEDFTEINYNVIAYEKAGSWMKLLQDSLGSRLFDSCMQSYFRQWEFRHTYPGDFQSVIENTSNKNLESQFALLKQKGPLNPRNESKKIKPAFLFSAHNTDKFNYLNLGPAAGFNMYDKFMIGAYMTNFNLPENNFQFLFIPLYATGSRQLNGIADISYSWRPDNFFQKISVGVNSSRFSTNAGLDTNNHKIFSGFSKIVPFIRLNLKNKNARSSLNKWIEFRTYLINEKNFNNYVLSPVDSTIHPISTNSKSRYLNQLTLNINDYRILYPYKLQLQLQQDNNFYRINFTSNYFFNYDNTGGMNVRLFAAKFGYWSKNPGVDASRYQPKLLGTTGEEDYTYNNYFLGRTASYAIENASINNGGLAAQQIMIRDGGLKLRIDQYDFLQGRSENWVAALNFNSTLPNHLFPIQLPIRIFFDVGTYAEAWKTNALTSRFLYVGGVQLSLIKNIVNIYIPIVYSSDFRDQLKTIPEQNTFWKKITFSIDIQNFDLKQTLKRHLFNE